MKPVFAHGQLRLYLLNLVAERPRHGYELITALSDRFAGTYRPSAGTVYPRLAKLEAEGLIRRSDVGHKGTYEITEAGRAYLASRADDVAAVEQEMADSVRERAQALRSDVAATMTSLRADLAAAAQQGRADTVDAPQDDAAEMRAAAKTAELELTEFRDSVRAQIRAAARSGTFDAVAAQTVQTVLDQAKRSISAVL